METVDLSVSIGQAIFQAGVLKGNYTEPLENGKVAYIDQRQRKSYPRINDCLAHQVHLRKKGAIPSAVGRIGLFTHYEPFLPVFHVSSRSVELNSSGGKAHEVFASGRAAKRYTANAGKIRGITEVLHFNRRAHQVVVLHSTKVKLQNRESERIRNVQCVRPSIYSLQVIDVENLFRLQLLIVFKLPKVS